MRVLIAPLDWGLGHATRCIPVIRELRRQGCEVLVAGSGDSLQLLKNEFPQLPFFVLPGYDPRYPASNSMVMSLAWQLPRFRRVIHAEHRAIEIIIQKEKIGLVISDNRFGCWSASVPGVFVTHQCNIMMPKGFGWLAPLVARFNNSMISRFEKCWIPDVPNHNSLAGELITFRTSPVKTETQYIGWLSRFEPEKIATGRYDVLALFSGPEPQRSIFEKIVVSQLQSSHLKYLIVRGLPATSTVNDDPRVVNFLGSAELQNEIQRADLVIARSGYSTVMDMHCLGKKAIFVPTPGQTEQEYLARRLMEKRIAFTMNQDEFQLEAALSSSKNFTGFPAFKNGGLLQTAVERLLSEALMLRKGLKK
jgi:uncharacterized protein (TIGR00661 family)